MDRDHYLQLAIFFFLLLPRIQEDASIGEWTEGDKFCVGCWQYVTTAEDIRSRRSISLILPWQQQKYETILSPYIIRVFFDEYPSKNQPFYSRRLLKWENKWIMCVCVDTAVYKRLKKSIVTYILFNYTIKLFFSSLHVCMSVCVWVCTQKIYMTFFIIILLYKLFLLYYIVYYIVLFYFSSLFVFTCLFYFLFVMCILC